jgi:hypothetical protein
MPLALANKSNPPAITALDSAHGSDGSGALQEGPCSFPYSDCDMSARRICKLLKGWRRGSESNRRIKVLQTSPLPLGYRAILNNCNAAPGRNRSGKCDFQTITLFSIPPCTTEIPGGPGGRAATWSGRRDLNPRPSPWQGDALPLSYSRIRPEAVYRSTRRRVNAGPVPRP